MFGDKIKGLDIYKERRKSSCVDKDFGKNAVVLLSADFSFSPESHRL
jgi:hypothetical protein